jgi:hypothetical protein
MKIRQSSRTRWLVAGLSAAALASVIALPSRPATEDQTKPATAQEEEQAQEPLPDSQTSIPTSVSTDPPADVTSPVAIVSPENASPLSRLVGGLLPPTMTVVYTGRDDVVVYDSSGVRLTIKVLIGGADVVRPELEGMEAERTPIQGGVATIDGLGVLTDEGDYVGAQVTFGDGQQPEPLNFMLPTVDAARGLVTSLVESLDPEVRASLQAWSDSAGAAAPTVDSSTLRSQVEAIGNAWSGAEGWSGAGLYDALNFQYFWFEEPGSSLTIALLALSGEGTERTFTQIDSTFAVAFDVANGWQLVITVADSSGGDLDWSDEELGRRLDELIAVVEQYRAPPVLIVRACSEYPVRVGDFPIGVADRFGVPYEQLKDANSDLEIAFMPGRILAIPCGGELPVRQPLTPEIAALADQPSTNAPPIGAGTVSRIALATQKFTYVISSGDDRLWVDRCPIAGIGDVVKSELSGLGCAGLIELVDDPLAPLDSIPLRCTLDGSTIVLDLFSGQVRPTD